MSRRAWLALAVLLWFAIGLAYYYAFHRPFTPQFAVQAAGTVRDLACSTALFAAAGALGTRLLAQLETAPLARLAVRGAAGLGVLSLVYLLVGSTLGTSRLLAWALVVTLLLTLRRDLRMWCADTAGWQLSGRFERVVVLLSGLIFACGLLAALAPPLVFDALVYHLTLPSIYLQQGQIGYVPEIMHWGQPQLVHMLVTWLGALGATSGALVAWGMAVLAVLGIYGHVAQRVGQRPAAAAIAALLCGASLAASLSSAYVDWPGILMGWAVLFFIDHAIHTQLSRWVVWAGVFCGLAFGTKYTAGLLAPLAVLALGLAGMPWRTLVRALGVALALALPWLVRNALATGNPFYPLLLPGGEMDAWRIAFVQGAAAQGNWLDVVLLPLRATWLGVEYGRVGEAAAYDVSVGPLLLLFGVLSLFFVARPAHLRRSAAVLALGGMAVWAVLGRINGHAIHTHLYYSLFPAFAILAAYGFAALQELRWGAVRVGRLAAVVAVLALGLNVLQAGLALVQRGTLELWAGTMNAQTYRERNLGLYALVIEQLPHQGRTLMLWEARGLACAPLCDQDEVIDRWQHDLARYGSSQAVIDSWRTSGYAYVLYYRLGAQFVYADTARFHNFDLPSLEAALATLPVVQDFNGDYVLYALQP